MSMQNTAIVARACRACLAGLALVILSASLAGAVQGPRTTIGQDYQQWSSTTSIDGITGGDNVCSNTFFCYVLFQPTPQRNPLIVQHVSCRLQLDPNDPGLPKRVHLTSRKGQTFQLRRTLLVPVLVGDGVWAINAPVKHLLKSGERAVIFFNGSARAWNPECNISGKLIQP